MNTTIQEECSEIRIYSDLENNLWNFSVSHKRFQCHLQFGLNHTPYTFHTCILMLVGATV